MDKKIIVDKYRPIFNPQFSNLKDYQKKFVNSMIDRVRTNGLENIKSFHYNSIPDPSRRKYGLGSIDIPDNEFDCIDLLNNIPVPHSTPLRLVFEIIDRAEIRRILFTDCSNHTYLGYPYTER